MRTESAERKSGATEGWVKGGEVGAERTDGPGGGRSSMSGVDMVSGLFGRVWEEACWTVENP